MRQCINKSYRAALITSQNPELREVDLEPSSKRGFINSSGYKSKNITHDLHLEHLNHFLKELLHNLRSNFNEQNADRIAKSLRNMKFIVDTLK